MRRPAAIGLVLLVAVACGGQRASAPEPSAGKRRPVVLGGDSLVVGDHLAFGAADVGTVKAALRDVFGADPHEEDLADCGEGPLHAVTFPGLGTYFQDGKLAGWGLRSGGALTLTTADGVGIGTTRDALQQAYGGKVEVGSTSLGVEWTAPDGISGLLDTDAPTGKVETMWAGMTCIAR